MSGDLWRMASQGTTMLPGEAKQLAESYARLQERYHAAMERAEAAERRCSHLAEQLAMLLGGRDRIGGDL